MSNNPNSLSVLLVEDAPADAALIERELQRGGFELHTDHATSLDEFVRALTNHPPDVILSDHGLPAFDGFAALAVARQRCPETPFIFVIGAMPEETAIKAIEKGATSYVLKSRLKELLSVVRRALALAREHHDQHLLELKRSNLIRDLQTALAQRAGTTGQPPLIRMCASCRQVLDSGDQWKPLESFVQSRLGLQISHGMCPECAMEWYGETLSKPH